MVIRIKSVRNVSQDKIGAVDKSEKVDSIYQGGGTGEQTAHGAKMH